MNPVKYHYVLRMHAKGLFINALMPIKTDHSLITLALTLRQSPERHKGFWKFNNSLLTDKDYVDKITNFWKHVIQNMYNSKSSYGLGFPKM